MPLVMTLDGARAPSRLDEIRGQLYSAMPRSWWRTEAQLMGVLDPIKMHPMWAIAGVVLGVWLVGSTTGKGLVSKVRRR